MTDDQIEYMVERFLQWKLPEDFSPDAGISFKADYNEGAPYPMKHEPSGTNLLNYTQAEDMVYHMVDGMSDREMQRLRNVEAAALSLSTAMVDSEEHGADYTRVDKQWAALTAALSQATPRPTPHRDSD